MAVRQIVSIDLSLHPYKNVLTQELKPIGHLQCRCLAIGLKRNLVFLKKSILSEESDFEFNGYVNKKNCQFWSKNNPHQIFGKPLHSGKVAVCCDLWHLTSSDLIVTKLKGNGATLKDERYQTMITDF